jgi:hypothetical protein
LTQHAWRPCRQTAFTSETCGVLLLRVLVVVVLLLLVLLL